MTRTRLPASRSTVHAPRPLVIALDLLAAVALLAGAAAVMLGSYRVVLHGVRISVSSPWRSWLLALAIVGLRAWLDPRPPRFERLRAALRSPLPLDEAALFGPASATLGGRVGEFALVCTGLALLVALCTWPQVWRMDGVPDLGDPLFSIWRLSWINHQIWRDPLALFDANIFFPATRTLTYSDSVIVPALAVAPLYWLGVPKVFVYNLLFLSAWALSGAAMYYLVRALTGRRDAALVSATVFALYSFRLEHYSHLELQMTMWMPLGAWALHRAIARGALRDGILAGLAFAGQMLSSMYYGMFFAVYLVVLGAALWVARRCPVRPIATLTAGAALAGLLIAPVASQYLATRAVMGDRDLSVVRFYSARARDYLKPSVRNRLYQRWSAGGRSERQLFPRLAPVALAGIGLWPPLSVARIGYAAACVLAFDGSLGVNGTVFPWLRALVPGYAGLRVPARFSILVGFSLAVLGGYGAARLFRQQPRAAPALCGILVAIIGLEATPDIRLVRVWPSPPAIYGALDAAPGAVVAEFPMPVNQDKSWFDTRYEYLSTFHWYRLVNGNSGFAPLDYLELLPRMKDFPSDAAVAHLRAMGVTHIALHGAFTDPTRYRRTCRQLQARGDLELVSAAAWEGSESRLYRFTR